MLQPWQILSLSTSLCILFFPYLSPIWPCSYSVSLLASRLSSSGTFHHLVSRISCVFFFSYSFFFLNGAAVSLHQPTLCIATFVPQHHRVFIWPFLFACLPWSLDIITSLSFNQLPTLLRHFQQPCTFSSPRWVTSPGYQAFEQRIWKPLHRWWTI
ncbi:hypothetical protein BDV34DRAFT_204306 [Aspergillus parasiticus]|uniref:Uncharacterized protein n=1 Tax=Aspergillus parasiticus TaxID=5067 RepID=A0A5N6D679_ASPPA|nr:hypothetical protein BDV34DRAFT_204306 [Aspergillus parasiticus]